MLQSETQHLVRLIKIEAKLWNQAVVQQSTTNLHISATLCVFRLCKQSLLLETLSQVIFDKQSSAEERLPRKCYNDEAEDCLTFFSFAKGVNIPRVQCGHE